ncbi:hypothetical protein ACFQ9D_06300 [Arthrobacter koreensis]|uniref:hypothetical protein n=1 Tax=Arthrobacter koreensis TaxID=199136 RepID=UPI003634570E
MAELRGHQVIKGTVQVRQRGVEQHPGNGQLRCRLGLPDRRCGRTKAVQQGELHGFLRWSVPFPGRTLRRMLPHGARR